MARAQTVGQPLSLRTLLRVTAGAVAVLVLSGVLAHVALTSRLRRATQELGWTIESVGIIERLEVDLLDYHTKSNLFLAQPDHDEELVSAANELKQRLESIEETRRYAHSKADEQAIAGAERNIHEYLASRRRIEEAGLPVEQVLEQSSVPLDDAFTSLELLLKTKLAETRTAQENAGRWLNIINASELSFAALLCVALGGAFFGMRRFVVVPLLATQEAMGRIGAGDKRARAREVGPAELRETVHSFNEMAGALERQYENELTFLAGVAHDLRNPLSALTIAMSSLEKDAALPAEARTRRLLTLIGRQIHRLSRLAGDLLDATRIESGHLELRTEVRDLRQIAREVVELYQLASSIHHVALVVPAQDVLVRCDQVRVEQVIGNLLSNAIKYSPEGGRVELSVDVDAKTGEAILTVTDQGIGISHEDQQHLFEPFRRTGSLGQTIPGAGLGLSVASRIVAAHGGRISVRSAPSEGSTFRVALPAASHRLGVE